MAKKNNEIMNTNNDDPVEVFTHEVLKRFDKEISEPITEMKDDIKGLGERMDKLENDTILDKGQRKAIKNCVRDRVHFLLKDETPKDYHKYQHTFFMRLHTYLNDRFGVTQYVDIRRVDFEDAREYINLWEPRGGVQALKDEIDSWKDDDAA